MDMVRDIAMVLAALLIAVGLAWVVFLELGSFERRLVGRARDLSEVLLPPVLTLVLLGVVWASFVPPQ